MKKSKLLIPALSIASVGAVVAPMVTSCAKENMIDLLNYESKFESTKPAAAPMSLNDAAKAYFDSNDSTKFIADDMYCFLGEEANLVKLVESYLPSILGYDDAEFEMKSAQCLVSNLKVVYNQTHKATISGVIKLKLETGVYEATKQHTDANKIGDYSLETQHTITDVPYVLWFSNELAVSGHIATGVNHAKAGSDTSSIRANKNWMITRSYTGKMVYKDNSEPAEFESQTENWYQSMLPTDDTKFDAWFSEKLSFLGWNSNYMWNITEKK